MVFLDWTESKLVELVERRLVRPFTAKPKLGGEAWSYFFDEMEAGGSMSRVMTLCQHRPRDVLMLTNYAINSALNNGHQKITELDLTSASQRYSTIRLKDLGDEFAENYPNISVVLELFYGLGTQYTVLGIESLLRKMLTNDSIRKHCSSWFFDYTIPFRFVELLYGIGFCGIQLRDDTYFKEPGKHSSGLPAIESNSIISIHPTYHTALNLRDVLIQDLADDVNLKHTGVLEDLPENLRYPDYKQKLNDTLTKLKQLPTGRRTASEFEEIVGDIIKLCFFRSLTNVEPKVRTHDGTSIRDWVASNRALDGFWEMVRVKYGATQVVWECKNYEDLSAEDFHQVCYYMNDTFGHFGVVACRSITSGIESKYFQHISNAVNRNRSGMIIVFTQRDLEVFLRQAISGYHKETHVQDRYDAFVRKVG